MRITLVVDNLSNSGLRSEHGLSFLVETAEGAALFDTGQSDAWVENLRALDVDRSIIKSAAISHGHYDHAGGLGAAARLLAQATLHAHQMCFEQKYAKTTNAMRYIGMPAESALIRPRFRLNRSATEILPGVTLSGEIALRATCDFEDRFLTVENGLRQDTFEDEQCMVIRNGDAVGVLIGCAHRGVENNLLAAMNVARVDRIDFIAGGMHLHKADEKRLDSLAGFLSEVSVGPIVCCHCTGLGAFKYLRSKLGPRISSGRAGMTWQV